MATARRRVNRRGPQPAEKPAAGRRDPKPRHTNGVRAWGVVLNRDPDYDYHFWAEVDTAHGLSEAMSQGWEPIEAKSDPHAERLQGGTTARPGEWVKSRGLVLCRRHKDHESAEFERDRKQAFTGQLAQDLGIASGTAQSRWNRGRIMGRDVADLDPSIEESVQVGSRVMSEANPYPAQPQE